MNRALLFFLLVFLLNPLVSVGQELTETNNEIENISDQYAECAAYFRLQNQALILSNEPETAKSYRGLEGTAMFYHLLLAYQGRSRNKAIEVTNSRVDMFTKKLQQEAANREEITSELTRKYDSGCQEEMENPSNHLLAILETKMRNANTEPAPN